MNLPWKEPSEDALRKKEMRRLVEIMRYSAPEDPTYKTAFTIYKNLRAQEIEYQKVRAFKWGRVFDAGTTLLTAAVVLTSEYWTPVTSGWGHAIMRPFSHNDNGLLS